MPGNSGHGRKHWRHISKSYSLRRLLFRLGFFLVGLHFCCNLLLGQAGLVAVQGIAQTQGKGVYIHRHGVSAHTLTETKRDAIA